MKIVLRGVGSIHRALRFLLLVALMLGGGCRREPAAASQGTVRLSIIPATTGLAAFAAVHNGTFLRHHVTTQETSIPSSNDLINALVAGRTDVAVAVSIIPLLHLELNQPGQFRLIGHTRMRDVGPFDSVIVRNESPIRSLADLAGHRIGVFPGTSATNLLRAHLTRNSVPTQGVEFIRLPPAAQLASLDSGAIDALFGYEPTVTTALLAGSHRRVTGSVYATLVNPCPAGANAISRRFEREHRLVAQQTLAALDEGTQWVRSHEPEARQELMRALSLPSNVASAVPLVEWTTQDEIDVANVQRFIDLLVEVGELPRRVDAARLVAPTP